jgi:RNA polymerase sigma factor (TIGR02999 family)
MTASSPQQITQLLVDWSNGDEAALTKLMPLVYQELRRRARRRLRGERVITMQTTDLVHEAFLRLANCKEIESRERAQFFALAAQVMRNILVDHSRARQANKRGDGVQPISLDSESLSLASSSSASADRALDILALNDALTKLEAFHPDKAKIIEMRFFAGMQNKEIAEVISKSVNQVIRDRRFAEAWLRRELGV